MQSPDPLKVLILSSSYPRSTADSASVFLRYMADALAGRGLCIHVVAPAERTSSTAREGDVTVHRFQYFYTPWQKLAYGSGMPANLRRNPWLWLQVPFYLGAMVWAVLRVVRREKIQLIHAQWIVPQALAGVIARALFKIPLVTTAHGADVFAFRGRIAKYLKRAAVARSDCWTANTRATADALLAPGCTPAARIIPIGVDIGLFRSGSRALRRQRTDRAFVVLFVGRLVEKKGCGDVLRAFALLPTAVKVASTLWIVGDGDQRSLLEQQARRLGLTESVRFWGTICNHELPDFYAAADLMVAPSHPAASGDNEGQGVVLLEAFAAGLCVLATRAGGIEEVITDGVTGILVEPQSPERLAQAIAALLKDPARRAALAANGHIEVQRYGWLRVAGKFESVYREVTGAIPRGPER